MRKDKLIFLLTSLFLGLLVVGQLKAVKVSSPWSKEQNLTWQIILLNQQISEKENQLKALEEQKERYQQNLNTASESDSLVSKEIDLYQKFLGQKEAYGSGIIVTIFNNPSLEEMVDLINSFKNIGTEGISINNQRLLCSGLQKEGDFFVLHNKKIAPPYEIRVIGNPDILAESLERKGGVIERLKEVSQLKISLEKKDQLVLPAYQ